MSRIGILAVIVATTAIAGCGGVTEETIVVKGKVMYDGAPVFPGAVLVINPDDEENRPFSGTLNEKGEFSFKVSKKGKYKLAVQPTDIPALSRGSRVDDGADPNSRESQVPEVYQNANVNIPPKYKDFKTSGLQYEVGNNPTEIGEIVLTDG